MTFKTVCVECGVVLAGDPEGDPVYDMCRRCFERNVNEPEQQEFSFRAAGKDFPIEKITGEDYELEDRKHKYMMGYDEE